MTTTTRTVDILFNMQAKTASADELLAQFDALQKHAKILEQEINKTGSGKGIWKLRAQLVQVKDQMKAIDAEAQKQILQKNFESAARKATELRERMEKLARLGTTMSIAGAAILAPFILATKKYMDTMKETEPTSARLVALGKRWEESQVRLGRVTATVVLPALEKALDIVEKIVAFAEKNPGAITAAVTIGTSLVVLGGIVTTTAKIIGAIATIQGFSAGAGAAGTAGGATAGGGLAAAAPAVGVLIAGAFVVELERRGLNKVFGTNQSWGDIGTTAMHALFLVLAKGNAEAAVQMENAAKAALHLSDAEEKASGSTNKFGLSAADWAQAVDAYTQMVSANAAAIADAAQQSEAVNTTYTADVAAQYASHVATMKSIGTQLAATLATIESNYAAASTAAAAAHAQQEADIIAQGAATIEQIISDSQERLRQMAEDHAQKVEGLTNSRDALGLAQENRDYANAVAEEKRRAQEASAAARKATQQQLAALDAQYAAEQAAAQAAYELEKQQAAAQASEAYLAEEAANKAKLEQLETAKNNELKAIETALKKELATNQRAYIDRLNALGVYLGRETELYKAHQAQMIVDTTAFVDAMLAQSARLNGTSTTTPAGMAAGGYTSGLVNTGERGREFILSNSTTRAAERMIGQTLTQANFLRALNGGVNVHQSMRFSGEISAGDKRQIQRIARDAAVKGFMGAIGA